MKYIKNFNESKEEITSEEGKNFLNIIRQKLPNKLSKYMSLIGNKGLDAAKKDFEINDPDEIKRREKERIKDEKEELLRNKKKNKLNDYEFDMLIDKYLKTEDFKEWLNNNGYPDIGNFPTLYKVNITQKRTHYEIEYKIENSLYSNFIFKIWEYSDKISIISTYVVKLNFFGNILFINTVRLEYDNTNLEKSIIDFLSTMKEDCFITNVIKMSDIKNLENFVINLENEKYIIPCKKDHLFRFKRLSDNNDFSFLKEILFTEYYYDGEYIYINILSGKYVFKFHEQYVNKVYKLYKKYLT
jgi:hypothetical protein